MRKRFRSGVIILLMFILTACGQYAAEETDTTGNTEMIQAVREAIDEGIIRRGDVFVTTKIYPGDEMKNPVQSIQACIDRLDIGYVDLMLLHHPDSNRRETRRVFRTGDFTMESAKGRGGHSRFL